MRGVIAVVSCVVVSEVWCGVLVGLMLDPVGVWVVLTCVGAVAAVFSVLGVSGGDYGCLRSWWCDVPEVVVSGGGYGCMRWWWCDVPEVVGVILLGGWGSVLSFERNIVSLDSCRL